MHVKQCGRSEIIANRVKKITQFSIGVVAKFKTDLQGKSYRVPIFLKIICKANVRSP